MRYLVFAGKIYYPGEGWKDWKGSFEDLEAAVAHAKRQEDEDWWHVVDLAKFEIVAGGYLGCWAEDGRTYDLK